MTSDPRRFKIHITILPRDNNTQGLRYQHHIMTSMTDLLPCLVCDQPLPPDPSARCLTDCSHEFCLSCLCRHLAANQNRCPGCHAQVKRVTQLLPQDADAPAPAFVHFCNAVYALNVSIWAVDDPAQVLAALFNLEHARLIHQGKLLKRGDVWPGSVVQLFGTQRGTLQTTVGSYWTWFSLEWLQRAKQVLCFPLSIVYDFFRSLFGNVEEQQQRGQRGYEQAQKALGDIPEVLDNYRSAEDVVAISFSLLFRKIDRC
ncbi:hypothetical protein PF005_g7030 [Phytophthora fragariae]|uniref:RING-type domain-containing protein n=1 Tax=Phytophthora fragariae TaxID=53985 RepID=A0A6A4DGU2_9STRA|nr:hypothetical protein PF003_g18895 [Phytophthora fragariae]KAE8942366.1 hypothetical protein PF009_g7875 [Phytophthora fragariae]KAE9014729.1 hypothetical protein PF011_g7932 [Phytophthora fragariae]KAE9109738.1 hypothetical protein PF007_g12129 [Phytophthora fragariae]KAE9118591.1 hypothetical protein PF010_g8162 [Phytophthora fragariae]